MSDLKHLSRAELIQAEQDGHRQLIILNNELKNMDEGHPAWRSGDEMQRIRCAISGHNERMKWVRFYIGKMDEEV